MLPAFAPFRQAQPRSGASAGGPLHFAHWSGSASYTLRINRAQAALARCTYSLRASVTVLAALVETAVFAARAPRLRLEYQPQ